MLAYEIHVTGSEPEADTERVRARLAGMAEEPVDPASPLGERVRALLVPAGVEWSFDRLREVVASLRAASERCAVTLVGVPDDDAELFAMMLRQARILRAQGHEARALGLIREARAYARHEGAEAEWERARAEAGPER